MERLSHDLNLALEESDCGRYERRKIGLRRRTRSAENLSKFKASAVSVSIAEDGSSSSPPQAPLITQPLSDSDDPHHNPLKSATLKSRNYCQIGNFESDSFNENFSPTRPVNARRKRKYKKIPVDYVDVNSAVSPPIEMLSIHSVPVLPANIALQNQELTSIGNTNKQKSDRNVFCGKRKWSHRDRGDGCEMRERSFSGGCSSKSSYFNKSYDFKCRKYDIDNLKKSSVIQPGKIVLKTQNVEGAKSTVSTPSLPRSSSFNFIHKNSLSKNGAPYMSKFTNLSKINPASLFNPSTSGTSRHTLDLQFGQSKSRKPKLLNNNQSSLRNPLQFDDSNSALGNESSSLSSSESDGIVTNDSDAEGDDELTDWPGIEELKVFSKSLTFKSSKVVHNTSNTMPPPKRIKKEKLPMKNGWLHCKNRFKKKRPKVELSGNEDDAMMSDSKTVVDLDEGVLKDILQPNSTFSTFSDIKNAGVSGCNADVTFFHSFQAFQEKSREPSLANQPPRTNFSLQKTSSSDLNLSEKSPQSDHYYSEHSMSTAATEVREIRAGCRRIREERPGFLILSAANEQLSKFLQDSCQVELKLPSIHDPNEKEKLVSLAKLYSLDLKVEIDRPVLRKTSNTTQAIRVEHSYPNFPSDHKRRCYGDYQSSLSISDHDSVASINDLEVQECANDQQLFDAIPHGMDKRLLEPGDNG